MKAWCIKNPEGRLCLRWMDHWESQLKAEFLADHLNADAAPRTWQSFSRKGWRCVQVEIAEVPK